MNSDLWFLIKRLTPSKPFTDIINFDHLKTLTRELRSKNQEWESLYGFLQNRSSCSSLQARYLTLQILHYYFVRSAHFRQFFCSRYFYPFLMNFYDDLNPKSRFKKRLDDLFQMIIDNWSSTFSSKYPQLTHLREQFPTKKDMPQETSVDRIIMIKEKYFTLKHITHELLNETQYLISLLETPEPKTDEYEEIIKDSLREKNKFFSKQIRIVDFLSTNLNLVKNDPMYGEMQAFLDSIRNTHGKALQYGMDGFEDIPD